MSPSCPVLCCAVPQLNIGNTVATPVVALATSGVSGANSLSAATRLALNLGVKTGFMAAGMAVNRAAWGSSHSYYNPIKLTSCTKEVTYVGVKWVRAGLHRSTWQAAPCTASEIPNRRPGT